MRSLVCEMCGSHDLVKENGVYVCQHCGTKYSVEEAKKMMVEGTVDVSGSTVKVDNAAKLENLYTLARRALKNGDWDNAHSYYKSILLEDANSWEAALNVPFTVRDVNANQGQDVIHRMTQGTKTAVRLIAESVSPDEQKNALTEVVRTCNQFANWVGENTDYFMKLNIRAAINKEKEPVPTGIVIDQLLGTATLFYVTGNQIQAYFIGTDEDRYLRAADAWKSGNDFLVKYMFNSNHSLYYATGKKKATEWIQEYGKKIQMFGVAYQVPEVKTGCYVATAVYGSYDCPQVWTLRRFRDNTLAASWYGRAFIRTYYAISPTLVKWFGDTRWFQKLCRGPLDSLVAKLNATGVADTPYRDRRWK